MGTVARIKKEGQLLLANTIEERLPVVTDGLVAYYPLDSNAGAIDVINGNGTIQNLETGMNIVEALDVDWKNPASWGVGVWDEAEQAMRFDTGAYAFMNVYIPIDTSKHWYIEATMKQGASAVGSMYLGTISYDANKTELAGHPGTYDYFGAVGVTVPTTWTTYNNNAISGAARTGENTNTNDYAAWQTGTKYARLLILTNYYGQAGPTWVKNLRFYHVDTNTSNVVTTEDGVAIQEATTSLINYGTEFNNWIFGSNSGSFPTVTPNCTFSPTGSPDADKIYIPNDGTFPRIYQYFTPTSTALHTFSIWLKTMGASVQTVLYIFRQSPWALDGGATVTITNVWQKFVVTFTPSDTTQHQIYIGSHDTTKGVTYFLWGAQLEAKSYASAFVNGSASQSNLFLPISQFLNNTTATINFDYYNYYGINNTLISGSIVQNSPPNGLWWGLYRDSGGNVYIHWLDGSSVSSGVVQSQNTWANYTISWDASYEYYYKDGVLLGQKAKSANLATNQLPTISLGWGWTSGDGRFKNFALYNRALSTNEIKALAGEGFKATITKATTPLLLEAPFVPADGFYFPLATDAKDVTKAIDASDNINVAFEDSAVWVGTATTNLFNSPDDFSNDAWQKGGITTPTPNIVKFTGDYAPLYQPKDIYPNGNVYSITWRMSGFVAGQKIRLGLENAIDSGYPQVILSKYMKTYYRSGTANGTGNFNPILYQFPDDNGNGSTNISTIRLLNAQLEQKSFPSPFVNGTRGASTLEYNLNSSIGLDWNGDWSITYWKKPVSTYNDNLTGYNIDSLGSNANGVGGGYLWWGKTYGSDDIYLSTPSSFSPSDYFNHWQFISLVKNGGTITTKTQLVTGTVYVRTDTIGSVVSNYYVNGYGYDFKLGGWDHANPTNTYFRDLIVVKRALSDSELQNIYKQFSIYTTKINTENLIEEGI